MWFFSSQFKLHATHFSCYRILNFESTEALSSLRGLERAIFINEIRTSLWWSILACVFIYCSVSLQSKKALDQTTYDRRWTRNITWYARAISYGRDSQRTSLLAYNLNYVMPELHYRYCPKGKKQLQTIQFIQPHFNSYFLKR